MRHLPKNRGLLGTAEVAFSEIVRSSLLDKSLFDLVNPDVRNFVLDQLLLTSDSDGTLSQLVFIFAHVICITLSRHNSQSVVTFLTQGLQEVSLSEFSETWQTHSGDVLHKYCS